ncbi:MAG: hypothetical protein WCD86_12880, partial [Ktedonobacteraceae bacterium]
MGGHNADFVGINGSLPRLPSRPAPAFPRPSVSPRAHQPALVEQDQRRDHARGRGQPLRGREAVGKADGAIALPLHDRFQDFAHRRRVVDDQDQWRHGFFCSRVFCMAAIQPITTPTF